MVTEKEGSGQGRGSEERSLQEALLQSATKTEGAHKTKVKCGTAKKTYNYTFNAYVPTDLVVSEGLHYTINFSFQKIPLKTLILHMLHSQFLCLVFCAFTHYFFVFLQDISISIESDI